MRNAGELTPWPGFARVEDISVITVDPPVRISDLDAPEAYDPQSTASQVLRLDDGPPYTSDTDTPPDMILLIRDVDLKLGSRAKKRVKGNDGNTINFVKDDYRIVLVLDGGNEYGYYSTFRDLVDSIIGEFDERLDVQRENVRPIGQRQVPAYDDDDEGERGQPGGEHADGDSEEDANAPPSGLPACWYVGMPFMVYYRPTQSLLVMISSGTGETVALNITMPITPLNLMCVTTRRFCCSSNNALTFSILAVTLAPRKGAMRICITISQ